MKLFEILNKTTTPPPFFHKPKSPRLYKVHFGQAYLELNQVNYKISTEHRKKPSFYLQPEEWLKPSLLLDNEVYILDCYYDVFIWDGRASKRMVKRAAMRLAEELRAMLDRPENSKVFHELQGVESVSFRSFFHGWDTILKLDYTKAPEKSLDEVEMVSHAMSKAAEEAKLDKENKKKRGEKEATSDLAALFKAKRPTIDNEGALDKISSITESIDSRHAFVLEDKKFVALPKNEYGIFYDHGCYVYILKSFVLDDDGYEEEETMIYFWEGLCAPRTSWITYSFTLGKQLVEAHNQKRRDAEARGEDVPGEITTIRLKQQQENWKFLAQFEQKMVVHHGIRKRKRKVKRKKGCAVPAVQPVTHDQIFTTKPSLYEVRTNTNLIHTRTIQVDCGLGNFNSEFCYILKVSICASVALRLT